MKTATARKSMFVVVFALLLLLAPIPASADTIPLPDCFQKFDAATSTRIQNIVALQMVASNVWMTSALFSGGNIDQDDPDTLLQISAEARKAIKLADVLSTGKDKQLAALAKKLESHVAKVVKSEDLSTLESDTADALLKEVNRILRKLRVSDCAYKLFESLASS